MGNPILVKPSETHNPLPAQHKSEVIECVAEPIGVPARSKPVIAMGATISRIGLWALVGMLLMLVAWKLVLVLIVILLAQWRFPKITFPVIASRAGSLYARGRRAIKRM